MSTSKRVKLFDKWATNYDQLIEAKSAPISFEGYERVLAEVVNLAQVTEGMRVLDLGTGTGNLASRFLVAGCEVWGIDFSTQMLAKAKEKLPRLHTVLADLSADEWPMLDNQSFDRIVSAYVLHDFDLSYKVQLLARLTKRHLADNGRILIADIAYPNQAVRVQAQTYWGRLWNKDEYYWTADETIIACRAIGLSCTYCQVSSCAGVFVMERIPFSLT